MVDQFTFLINQYPVLAHVVAFVIGCRIIFKPLFAILGKYVELTVEEDDNKKLNRIMNTKTYKMVAFAADYFASVKLPVIKK